MDNRTENILNSMGHSHFWRQAPSEGMGAAYLLNKYPNMDIKQWSNISTSEIEQELYLRMNSEQTNIRRKELKKAVDSSRAGLEQAIFKSAEKEVRKKACSMMRKMADDLEHASVHHQAIGPILADVQNMQVGQERIAMLESLGLTSEAARGLDLQMTMNTPGQIMEKLSENRLTMISTSPLSLQEVSQSMRQTAGAMRKLASRLEIQRDINVFDLCPEIARGVMSQLKKDSIAYQAIDSRLKDHQMYKKADRILGLTAGILFEIGALTACPGAKIAHAIWTGAGALNRMSEGVQKLKLSRLSHLAGAMSSKDFSAKRESAYKSIILGTSTSLTHSMPFTDTVLNFYQHRKKQGDSLQ